MQIRILSLGAAALAAMALAAACGDGPGGQPTPTPAATPASSITPNRGSPTEFGPEPRLGGNITGVAPAHAQRVRAPLMKITRLDQIGGVCFDGNFAGFEAGNLQWFRMAVDGEEVTEDLVWFVNSDRTKGTACYQTTDGLEVGKHTAAVSVQNPTTPSEPTRQVVSWVFEITE